VEHSAVVVGQVDVLVVPADVLDDLVRADHRLARELGRQLDQRRQLLLDPEAASPGRRPAAR
jgi:CRP-like cAMP-binding protein